LDSNTQKTFIHNSFGREESQDKIYVSLHDAEDNDDDQQIIKTD